MQPDPKQEQFFVRDILDGLIALETQLQLVPASGLSPLFPFKVACQVYEKQRQMPFDLSLAYENPKFRECIMLVAAAMDLVRYHRAARGHRALRKLGPHFAQIGGGFFGIAGTYGIQMSKGCPMRSWLEAAGVVFPDDAAAKDATRKTIELMFALAALNAFETIEVEDPKDSGSSAPNPDLIVGHDGKRYGIACKSVSSVQEETIKDNVAKGVEQLGRAIEAGGVDPRCGVVVLDVSAILKQDRLYMPGPGQFWEKSQTGGILCQAVDEALQKIYGPDPARTFQEILGPIYKGSDLPPGVLIYAHGLMLSAENEAVSPVYQKSLRLGFGGDTSELTPFNTRLDRALNCQPLE